MSAIAIFPIIIIEIIKFKKMKEKGKRYMSLTHIGATLSLGGKRKASAAVFCVSA